MEKSCGAFFFSWPEAYQAGVEAVGGKGWNLSRLVRYGFRVPAGGVLAAGAYRAFWEENNLLETVGNIAQSITIGNIGEKGTEEKLFLIREKIKAGHISQYMLEELTSKLKNTGILKKPLAVRSSATAEDTAGASFAGIHESFLNVRGLDNVLSAIKGCYASLWTPRAVAYRRKMNVKDDEVFPAVVIMEMVEAVAAGIGFTCDPRTGRECVTLINANFGLGESVVSGAVEPDEYRLDFRWEVPERWTIAEKRIGRKEGKTVAAKDGGTEFIGSAGSAVIQVLADKDIHKLNLLILRVYDALGGGEQHQDIEWVFDGRDFSLVQARPVTALPRYTFDEIKNQPDMWSNANLRDTMPMVQSTLNWSFLEKLWKVPLKSVMKQFGYQNLSGFRQIRLYQGRAYTNISYMQWLFYDAFGFKPRQMNESLGGHQPEIKISEKSPYRGIKGFKRLVRLLKTIPNGLKIKKNAPKIFENVNGLTGAFLKENFKNLADKDLLNKSAEIRNAIVEFYPVLATFTGFADMSLLVKALEKFFPGKGKAMANALMAGGGDITSAQQGYRLVELATIARGDAAARRFFTGATFDPLRWEKVLPEESPFRQSFRDFLAEYGHRGIYEMDIINPRWRDDPSYLLNVLRSTIETADTGKIKARQKEKANEARQEVNQKVPFYRRGLINNLLKQAIKGAELREMAKSMLIKLYEPERIIFQETGRRLAERGILAEQADIYHCAWNEIFSILKGEWDGRGLDVLVGERKARREELGALSSPDLIIDEAPQFSETVTRSSGNALAGMGVAAGRASGAARLIGHPDEGEKLQAGDVLVTPSTDPGWTPLFLRASAIVVETGGFLSHGAIVAREYGIPAVVNIPGVMKMIKDSQLVTVDGDGGKVYI
ncbi:pyruvate, water dikinase [Desulfotomaculum arcticum]|uniref:Pyruvate, water dikinase n=1 Tax=Desulfotruncus arcticus DSM 17038 TaxID=1121424 RepID=A0A1I2VZN3_9FIRM|nr:PEP/pyruvate-binding domain-containing protein [Desulfotruncus arcticus]SFG93266.1 pyruvate, water dikinase [Desulfotomaculum arcticum] [Desulfotruncus arcticus DSM 17038]